jgi:hypothetical protein
MRVIKEFNLNQTIKGTLFGWNGKYIVKLENGNLEQTYKIPETDVTGITDIDSLLANPDFLAKAEAIFSEMDSNLDSLF